MSRVEWALYPYSTWRNGRCDTRVGPDCSRSIREQASRARCARILCNGLPDPLAHQPMFDSAIEEDIAFRHIAKFRIEGNGVQLGFENQLGKALCPGRLLRKAHY